ncbi:hypothetical protein ATO49_13000 [Mycolicibacterium fortuitum subsp. fortuitum DSM 46621 = ATCC 6841 = JCM 6387]|nr:hypothetical protein ATO49_13000 [Mycolicibacterium fortuitum subsp. fortuitum DSM 46621 = ATCC 6841 = JCM 6387]
MAGECILIATAGGLVLQCQDLDRRVGALPQLLLVGNPLCWKGFGGPPGGWRGLGAGLAAIACTTGRMVSCPGIAMSRTVSGSRLGTVTTTVSLSIFTSDPEKPIPYSRFSTTSRTLTRASAEAGAPSDVTVA